MSRRGGPPASIRYSLAHAAPSPYWLDSPLRPQQAPPLVGDATCDLAVVGAGYTGLWTALLAKEGDPGRDVLLIEGQTAGWAASGRNGGFCAASLTHGIANGVQRFPTEMAVLDRLGRSNLDEIEKAVAHYGIDCAFERTGSMDVATAPHQLPWLVEDVEVAQHFGHDCVLLGQDQVRAELASPTFVGAAWHRDTTALVDPARLAWGLRAACERVGVRIAEGTEVTDLSRDGSGVRLVTPRASVRAGQVALATNAFPALLGQLRRYVVPVYDYVLVTEPLNATQLAAIGWQHRQGVGDVSNQFHYYRLTADDRILWGGYDAIYHYGNGLKPRYDQRPATFTTLAAQFFDTFPQLEGTRFTHRWGGAIDTSTRFFAFQRTALDGRVAYSLGYTGLGVAATRFGAQVMLDLLAGRQTEATGLRAIRRRPLPFPPEPARYLGIQLTRRALAKADRRDGRRGPWLRTLDRLGLGFDS
jgi:glycine/D-amino acid oxidase-like deaminating enzyme